MQDSSDDITFKYISEYRLIDQIFDDNEEEEEAFPSSSTQTKSTGQKKDKIPTKNSASIKQHIRIFPVEMAWNYKNLSCFLNELIDFKKVKRRSYQTDINKKGVQRAKFTFYHHENPDYKVYINIANDIKVKATIQYVFKMWIRKSAFFYSKLRTQCRSRKDPILQKHFYFELNINNPSSGTKTIYMNIPFIQTGIYDFSEPFDFFVKKIQQFGLQINSDTFFIYDYFATWNKKTTKSIYDLSTLKSSIKGFLKFDIQKSNKNRNLCKIEYKGEQYNIIGGIYIHPYAYSILKENQIVKGFMIDTTFKAMPHYLTSFIMASTQNAGISLSFSFGLSESKELYQRHFKTFQEELQIDLSQYVFLRDQGSAICAICDDFNVTNLCCLRHLLASLKYSKYSFAVSNFLTCKSNNDFEFAKLTFLPFFNEFKEEEIEKLNKTFSKIGLEYKNKDVVEMSTSKWMRSSLIMRPINSKIIKFYNI